MQGEGVERIFPVHSPRIAKIEVKKAGLVRRAKLYYLRDRVGKATKIKDDVKRQMKIDADAEDGGRGSGQGRQAAANKEASPTGRASGPPRSKAKAEAAEEVTRWRPTARATPGPRRSRRPSSRVGRAGGGGSASARERAAARFLRRLGYRILAANVADPTGELDLLALDGDTLVVVEVRSTAGGRPRASRPRRWTSASSGSSPRRRCASCAAAGCSADRGPVRRAGPRLAGRTPANPSSGTSRHAFEAVGRFQMFT